MAESLGLVDKSMMPKRGRKLWECVEKGYELMCEASQKLFRDRGSEPAMRERAERFPVKPGMTEGKGREATEKPAKRPFDWSKTFAKFVS